MGYIELEFNQQGMTKELIYNSCHYNEKELAWILTYKPQKFTRRVILLKLNENDYKKLQSIVNYMETFHLKICGDYSPWTAAPHPYPLNNSAKSKDPSSTLEDFEIEPTPHNEGVLIQTPTIELLSSRASLPADIKMYDIDEKGEKTLYARFFSDQSKAGKPVTDSYNFEDEFLELDELYNKKSRLATSNSDGSNQRAMVTTYLSQNNIKESVHGLTMSNTRILVNHESSISLKISMGRNGEGLANIRDIAEKYQNFLIEVTGEYYQEDHLWRSEVFQTEDFVESQIYIVINKPEIKFINGTPKIDPYENESLFFRASFNINENTFSRAVFNEMYEKKILTIDDIITKYNFYLTDEQWAILKNVIHNKDGWAFVLEGSYTMKVKDRTDLVHLIAYGDKHKEELTKKHGSMEEYYRLISCEKSFTVNIESVCLTEKISENNEILRTSQMIH